MRPPAFAALAAAALAAPAGCCSTGPHLKTYPQDVPASTVLQVFDRHATAFKGFKAKVEGNSPEGSFSGVMLLDRPDRFRFQTYKLWVSKLFDLTVRGGELSLYIPARGKVLRSTVARESGSSRGFPVQALLRALLSAGEPGSRVALQEPGGAWVVEKYDGGVRAQRFVLEPGTLVVASELIFGPGGEVALEVRLSDYRLIGEVPFPGRMEIVVAGRGPFALEFGEVVIDPPFDDRHFELDLPPDVAVVADLKDLEN